MRPLKSNSDRGTTTKNNFKYATLEEAVIAQYWPMWSKSKVFKTRECAISKEEFIALWTQSGKWSERGNKFGCYYIEISGTGPVTKDDCSIVQRTQGTNAGLKRVRLSAEEKQLRDAEKQRLREEKKALRPESEPDPRKKRERKPKVPKERKARKPREETRPRKTYMKSDRQALKEYLSTQKSTERAKYMSKVFLSEEQAAIDSAIKRATKNAELLEKLEALKSVVTTDHVLYNLQTKRVIGHFGRPKTAASTHN